MSRRNQLIELLGIEMPIIMAPMFLVSNVNMVVEAMRSGIAGVIPSLNYLTGKELAQALEDLNKFRYSNENRGTYGINLIVQSTNKRMEEDLKICVEKKVPFYITSLGNPEKVVEQARTYGAKVLCDVTNIKHAQRVYEIGVDGFIAVGSGAGGHAGTHPNQLLVPALIKHFPDKPVFAAGGIANGKGILSMLALGAVGVSLGTLFITSTEAGVSDEYKKAIVDSGMKDIIMTSRLSGAPVSIINTPFYRKLKEQDEKADPNSKDSLTKLERMEEGISMLEKSIQPGNYNNLWVAGHTVELIDEIRSVKDIINRLKEELKLAIEEVREKDYFED
ncbi:MAG: nitronate monooxygenase [Bacteroidota bacterium]|nr:nitronate monooxygenase [Bacteroidota bacterium]